MIHYLWALTWGAALLLSFFGYGTLLGTLVCRRSRPSVFRRAAWGFAVVMVLAGLMNLAGAASRTGLLTLILAGMIPAAWGAWRERGEVRRIRSIFSDRTRMQTGLRLLLTFCAILLILRVASAVDGARSTVSWASVEQRFNLHDDMHSYLVYPFRMLQTGSLGQDPFNARRNEASVGGIYVPTALILVALPEDNAHFFEAGLALLLVCGLIWEFAGILRVSHPLRAVMVLYALFILFYNANLTSYLSGAAIILAVLCTLASCEWSENGPVRSGILIGVLIGAMASLKSTFIPPLAILLTADFLWRMIGKQPAGDTRAADVGRLPNIRMYAAIAVVTVAVMLPWMLDLKGSAGTLLYPLLGRGYHGSVFGPYALPGEHMSDTLRAELYTLVALPLLLGASAAVILYRFTRLPWEQRGAVIATLIAWGVGLLVIGRTTGYGAGVERYIFSVALVGQIALLGVVFAFLCHDAARSPKPGRARAIVISLACLAFRLPEACVLYGYTVPLDLWAAVAGPIHVYDPQRAQMAAMQSAIPPGEPLMARLTHPHALDFRRNPIFVPDWPGEFSAPPGLPLKSDGEAVATYMRERSIRYVAYSYRAEANYQYDLHVHRLGPNTATWDRTVTENTFKFQANLVELGRTRRRIYDDGDVFVIDLQHRVSPAAPADR